MLLEDKTLLNCNYEAKKMLFLIDLEYRKIHISHNDCVLYINEFVVLR